MPALPSVTSIASVRYGSSASASSTPSSRRSSRDGGFAPLERFGGAVLQLGGEILVEALDRGDFVELDIGDLFEAAKPSATSSCASVSSTSSSVWNISERSTNSRWRFSLASASVRMSIAEPVSWLARRTFWPRRPIARLS